MTEAKLRNKNINAMGHDNTEAGNSTDYILHHHTFVADNGKSSTSSSLPLLSLPSSRKVSVSPTPKQTTVVAKTKMLAEQYCDNKKPLSIAIAEAA